MLQAAGAGERTEGETLELVGDAVKAKLLRDTGGGPGQPDLEFSARAVQDESYRTMDPALRKETHAKVGEAMGDQKAAAAAFHFGRAGDTAKRDRFLAKVRGPPRREPRS